MQRDFLTLGNLNDIVKAMRPPRTKPAKPAKKIYTIQHLPDFSPNLYGIPLDHRGQLIEDKIALTPNRLAGLIAGFAITENYIGDVSKYLRIRDPSGNFVDPMNYIRNFKSAQFAGEFTGTNPGDDYDLLKYMWSIHRGKPNTKYHLLISLPDPPFKRLAWGFDNRKFLQGFLTACQWLNKDCRDILQVFDQNGNRLEY